MRPVATSTSKLSLPIEEIKPHKIIYFLVILLSLYLAAPLWDLPLLGLSLSALIIFFLFFETFRHLGGLGLRRLGMLPWLLIFCWFSQLFSLAVNEIFDDQSINFAYGLTTLFRYAFWFMVACLSARIMTVTKLLRVATYAFGAGCLITAIAYLGEHFFLGGLSGSGWSRITGLSQNSYGWQFSAFTPCVFYLVMLKGRQRSLAVIGAAVVLLAVLLNGSRSSWGTVSLGLILFALLWVASFANIGRAVKSSLLISFVFIITTTLFILAPANFKERLISKIERSQDISRDKSWQIRLLMVQKGKTLFSDNILFGVGPGQFRYTQADLDIPLILSGKSEESLNQRSSHNSYIQLLAEGGLALAIPFGTLLLWLLVAGCKAAIANARCGEPWVIPIYVGFICFSIHFWSVAGITSTAPWVLYGMVAAGILRGRALSKNSMMMNREIRHEYAPRFPLPHSR